MKNSIALISKYRNMLFGLAAIWIYLAHEWVYLLGDFKIACDIEYIISYGFCGVDIFILLSGLGLIYSIEKRTVI